MDERIVTLNCDAEVIQWLVNNSCFNGEDILIVRGKSVWATNRISCVVAEYETEAPLPEGNWVIDHWSSYCAGYSVLIVYHPCTMPLPWADRLGEHFAAGSVGNDSVNLSMHNFIPLVSVNMPAEIAVRNDRVLVTYYEDEYHKFPVGLVSLRGVLMAMKRPIDNAPAKS